ncbi:MAG TPA: beta-ketoacyl-[acyl-carrier-protein] synthase family protein [Rhodocyclaceae bacterium]|nr:beta-ketoacyl-[acyl-carrier-protein] synthase family protein [Rhodocyclaceae bacterium]
MPESSYRRVAVTGLGVVSPFEGNAQNFFDSMMHGRSAIRLYQHPLASQSLAVPAVYCDRFDAAQSVGRPLANTMDRFSQLGGAAAFAAWEDAGLQIQGTDPGVGGNPRYGVSWGTGVGGTLTFEHGYREIMLNGRERVPPLSVVLAMNNAAASHVAIRLGLGGSCLTYSVACASSAVAVGEAFQRIRSGQDTIVIAGGSEAPLSEAVVRAWDAMRVMASGDEETAPASCRPFHARRAGLVLGEGAAALVLEDWEHASRRNARIYAELVGYGASCDHAHLVKPAAEGQSRAVRAALTQAELAPHDIGYVNAHGTATREGDPTEIGVLREVFGSAAEALPVSATKSMHGHLLGATGAVEALVTVLAIHNASIPPTFNLDEVAEDCHGVRHVVGEGQRSKSLKAALSNSFAFGGSNVVLAFKQVA